LGRIFDETADACRFSAQPSEATQRRQGTTTPLSPAQCFFQCELQRSAETETETTRTECHYTETAGQGRAGQGSHNDNDNDNGSHLGTTSPAPSPSPSLPFSLETALHN
jgi:hypothetical protein